MKSTIIWRHLGALATLAIASVGCVPAAHAEADVLERPAMRSAKAASAVMLAIAQTGKRIVAVGERGIIVYSDDDGRSWQQASVPVSVSLAGVTFVNQKDGWAVGHSGVVLHTSDGGKTWTKQLDGNRAAKLVQEGVKAGRIPAGMDAAKAAADAERLVVEGPSKPFLDIHFFDDKNGLVIGAFGLVFATADGGQTWQPAFDRFGTPKDKHLYSLQAEGSDCVIAGEQGAVFYSNNACKSFNAVNTPYEGTYFGAIVAGPRSVVVYGMRGNVYWSDDAGASWKKSDISTPNSITAGLRLKDGEMLVADETGQLYRSTDAGKSFKHVPIAQASPFTGVIQSADGGLFLSGVRGVTRIALNQ
ncbi:MAG TPA: YCF48-related protein [Noviherbaspirillum sp.]